MQPMPRMPPVPSENNGSAQRSQIVNLPAGYAYLHTSLHCAELFTFDSYAQDSQRDTDFNPDKLTDEGSSTG